MNRQNHERELIVRLFQTSNALQTYLDRLLKQDHLTAKQFFMMIFIGNLPQDPSISELALMTQTSHQNTKQVLLKLQKQDYIELYKDEHDSRISRATLTQKAMQYWQARSTSDALTINRLFETLQDSTLQTLVSGLEAITNQLTNDAISIHQD